MADVPWFKVLTDIFSDDKIKIIQSMPEGDSLLVMWFKVLSQAGKTNDGGYIYLKKTIPYSPAMLATLFGKQQQLVELAMRTFSEFGMIDIDEKGYVFVTNWEKHQSIDKLEKIKEQNRLRQAVHRESKRIELEENNVTVTLPSLRNNAIDKDIDIDKEKRIPSLEIENFRKRYSEFQLTHLDNYFDMLRHTRKSAKISPNVIADVYAKFDKYPVICVEYAIRTHYEGSQHHSKQESYTLGILNKTDASESTKKLSSPNISKPSTSYTSKKENIPVKEVEPYFRPVG